MKTATVPTAHQTENRKMHGYKPHLAPLGCYIIAIPKLGSFLAAMLPNVPSCADDSALFYAVVDDFGDLVAVA